MSIIFLTEYTLELRMARHRPAAGMDNEDGNVAVCVCDENGTRQSG